MSPKIQQAIKQINLRVSLPLLRRIDEARGDVARERWIRRAVERALEEPSAPGMASRSAETLAPAEQPYRQHVPGPNVENVRSSSQAKRNTQPYPKKGKST